MNEYQHKLNSLGIEIPYILLPKAADMQKWTVIACDQYTQDRDYWQKSKTAAAGSPSTLNMIFPEVFLTDDDAAQRINDIHSTMNSYLLTGVFNEPRQGFIYLERDTPFHKKRRGLIAAIDLEQYDWHPEARPLIRCTEGTVPERLPPRMDIRRGAPLELPHVLLLVDDDTGSLLPGLGERVKDTAPVYSTPLMMDSGNVTGWFLDGGSDIAFIMEKLDKLYQRSCSRYDNSLAAAPEGAPFLFAVGDGNHSLAAARGIWKEYKAAHTGKELPVHPCRYALVEIENIYDPAIQFEPIHRLVFDAGFDDTVNLLSQLPDFSCRPVNSTQELSQLCAEPSAGSRFGIISQGRYAIIETSASGIATACLQPLLDKYAASNPHLIDYIHDEQELFRLSASGSQMSAYSSQMSASGGAEGKERMATGILLPPVKKSGLFETVSRLGPLPRKSFSMGHSCEKRFYLECRALLP